MAVLRLTNGGDIAIKLGVEDAQAALKLTADADAFVELPGEEGPIHLRPSHVIAILDSIENRHAGFRALR